MDIIKISVVEDNLLSRLSLKHSLSFLKNIKVIGDYASATELIQALKMNKTSDVILMDLDLKNMNGIQATNYLKQHFPRIKVIILTEHSGKDFLNASIACGARGFLSKSTSTQKLVKIIEAIHFGAYWFDSMFDGCIENFPKPNTGDLWNLYEKKQPQYDLTAREMQVLKLVAQGKSNTEIAKEIIVSTNTAKAHVGNILNKMHVTDRVQAAVKAVKTHII